MDRRQLLRALAACGVIGTGLLVACGSKPTPPAGADAGVAGNSGWDRMRDALAAIRVSPDHLGARADEVVASRDAERIAAFVRERITVLPALSGFSDAATLWGARATLRGGAGTLRDRAELLMQLLNRAGFRTSMVSIGRPANLDARTLFKDRAPQFQPDLARLEPLLNAARQSTEFDATPDRAVAESASRLADELLALIAEDARTLQPLERLLPDTLPVVEYQRDGQTGWAIACGELTVMRDKPPDHRGMALAIGRRRVVLSVSVALHPPLGSPADRSVLHEVLRTEWDAEDLAGRQVVLGFIPPGDPRSSLGRDLSTATTRIPMLRVMSRDTIVPQAAAGHLIRLEGEVVAPAAAAGPATASTPGAAAAPPVLALAADARGALAGQATRVVVAVNPSSFPDVDLSVAIVDRNDASVNGLGPAELELTEDGTAQGFSLTRNTVPKGTRILVLYDTSGSITAAWGTHGARSAFEASLADELTAVARGSPYLIQVIGLGSAAAPGAWMAPDAVRLREAFGSVSSNSEIWRGLGQSLPQSGASAALLVSDNASSLELPEEVPGFQKGLRASGLPVGLLPIGEVDLKATALIKTLTSAIEFTKGDPGLARRLGAFVEQQVRQAESTNYRLRYRASEQGATRRQVQLRIRNAARIAGTASYTVPVATERAVPSAIAGVFLTIDLDGKSVRRRLGGVNVSYRGTVADTADAAAIAAATQVLNGLHTVHFEPARPTTAALLDDALTAALTLEPVWAAQDQPLDSQLRAASAIGRFDPFAAALLDATADNAVDLGGAVPGGLRVILTSDMPDGKGAVRKVDVVPEFNRWRGLHADARKSFLAAMRRSLPVSLREAQFMADSAARRLRDQTFVVLPRFASAASVPAWSPAQRATLAPILDAYDGMIRLVPASGDVPAMWVVDPASGSTVAVSADGRGGAQCTLGDAPALQAALILLSAACTFSGPAAGSSGFYACVGADAYGAGTAGAESFSNPAEGAAQLSFTTVIYAAQLGLASVFGGPENAMARGLIAVLLAMLSTVQAFCPPKIFAS